MSIHKFMVRWPVVSAMFGLYLVGCFHMDSHQGSHFIWVDRLEAEAEDPRTFRLQAGDRIRISVWKQDELSGELRIRSDGRITMPVVGDVRVAGLTPSEAAGVVKGSLLDVVRDPAVAIDVIDVRPLSIGVLGEVERPGVYEIDRGSGVLHAIATAGGLTEYADHRRIFVIRNGNRNDIAEGGSVPIRFKYRMLVQGREPAAGFVLAPGDLVVVE